MRKSPDPDKAPSAAPLHVLLVTSDWPSPWDPESVPFLVQEVEFLRRAGVQVDVFHFLGAMNPLRYLAAWLRLQGILARGIYDLVHAHFGQSGLLAFPRRLPLVVTFHGSDLQGVYGPQGRPLPSGRLLQALSRSVAQRADEVIVVSRALAERLPAGRPYHLIPGGVDLDRFRPMDPVEARRALGLPERGILVLFGGNPLHPQKRHGLALNAVSLLGEKQEARLVTMEDVPHARVPLYMNACDVLLLTSVKEGSPTVVKEALACNLPVVSTDVGDVRQRIGHLDGCVVCEDDSPAAIAQGLGSALASRRAFQGRHSVADLDESLVVKRILEVYGSALARWSGAPDHEGLPRRG